MCEWVEVGHGIVLDTSKLADKLVSFICPNPRLMALMPSKSNKSNEYILGCLGRVYHTYLSHATDRPEGGE